MSQRMLTSENAPSRNMIRGSWSLVSCRASSRAWDLDARVGTVMLFGPVGLVAVFWGVVAWALS